MVGRQVLALKIEVRILAPQPNYLEREVLGEAVSPSSMVSDLPV